MTLTYSAKAGEGEGGSVSRPNPGGPVDPFRHQVGSYVGKMIAGESKARVRCEVVQVGEGTNLDDVLNFFDNTLHLIY